MKKAKPKKMCTYHLPCKGAAPVLVAEDLLAARLATDVHPAVTQAHVHGAAVIAHNAFERTRLRACWLGGRPKELAVRITGLFLVPLGFFEAFKFRKRQFSRGPLALSHTPKPAPCRDNRSAYISTQELKQKMTTEALGRKNQQQHAESLRYLIMGGQNDERQIEVLRQLVETSSLPELNFLRNQLVFNSKDKLKEGIDPLQKTLLLKGTNLPQLLVLLSNIPSAYNGHPLFNRALIADIDDSYAFSKRGFQVRFTQLQNYINFESIEVETGRVFDEMSAMEHVYNKTGENKNLHAVSHAALRRFLFAYLSSSPAATKKHKKIAWQRFTQSRANLAKASSWSLWGFTKQITTIKPEKVMLAEEKLQTLDSVDILCYRIQQKLWILRKAFEGFEPFDHMRAGVIFVFGDTQMTPAYLSQGTTDIPETNFSWTYVAAGVGIGVLATYLLYAAFLAPVAAFSAPVAAAAAATAVITGGIITQSMYRAAGGTEGHGGSENSGAYWWAFIGEGAGEKKTEVDKLQKIQIKEDAQYGLYVQSVKRFVLEGAKNQKLEGNADELAVMRMVLYAFFERHYNNLRDNKQKNMRLSEIEELAADMIKNLNEKLKQRKGEDTELKKIIEQKNIDTQVKLNQIEEAMVKKLGPKENTKSTTNKNSDDKNKATEKVPPIVAETIKLVGVESQNEVTSNPNITVTSVEGNLVVNDSDYVIQAPAEEKAIIQDPNSVGLAQDEKIYRPVVDGRQLTIKNRPVSILAEADSYIRQGIKKYLVKMETSESSETSKQTAISTKFGKQDVQVKKLVVISKKRLEKMGPDDKKKYSSGQNNINGIVYDEVYVEENGNINIHNEKNEEATRNFKTRGAIGTYGQADVPKIRYMGDKYPEIENIELRTAQNDPENKSKIYLRALDGTGKDVMIDGEIELLVKKDENKPHQATINYTPNPKDLGSQLQNLAGFGTKTRTYTSQKDTPNPFSLNPRYYVEGKTQVNYDDILLEILSRSLTSVKENKTPVGSLDPVLPLIKAIESFDRKEDGIIAHAGGAISQKINLLMISLDINENNPENSRICYTWGFAPRDRGLIDEEDKKKMARRVEIEYKAMLDQNNSALKEDLKENIEATEQSENIDVGQMDLDKCLISLFETNIIEGKAWSVNGTKIKKLQTLFGDSPEAKKTITDVTGEWVEQIQGQVIKEGAGIPERGLTNTQKLLEHIEKHIWDQFRNSETFRELYKHAIFTSDYDYAMFNKIDKAYGKPQVFLNTKTNQFVFLKDFWSHFVTYTGSAARFEVIMGNNTQSLSVKSLDENDEPFELNLLLQEHLKNFYNEGFLSALETFTRMPQDFNVENEEKCKIALLDFMITTSRRALKSYVTKTFTQKIDENNYGKYKFSGQCRIPDKTSFNQKLRILKFLKKKGGTAFENSCTVCLENETAKQCARARAQARIDARPDIKLNDEEYTNLLEEMLLEQEKNNDKTSLLGAISAFLRLDALSAVTLSSPFTAAPESVDYTSKQIVKLKKDEGVFIQLPSNFQGGVLFAELEEDSNMFSSQLGSQLNRGPHGDYMGSFHFLDITPEPANSQRVVVSARSGLNARAFTKRNDMKDVDRNSIKPTEKPFSVTKNTLVMALKAYSQIVYADEIINKERLEDFFENYQITLQNKGYIRRHAPDNVPVQVEKDMFQRFILDTAEKYQLGNTGWIKKEMPKRKLFNDGPWPNLNK